MLPLPANQREQEDAVLVSLVARIRAAGLDAVLVENPDRRRAAERRVRDLTSDGLIEVDGAWWSVDVMSVTTPVDLYVVPEMLEDRLLPVAEGQAAVISFSGTLPVKASVNAVVAAAQSAMAGSPAGWCSPSPNFAVTWRPVRKGECARVETLASLDESPLLSDQVAVAIERSLTRKATVQARPARLAGCGTAVALDQVGHLQMKAGTQWLPQHPNTFRVAVEAVLADLPEHFLDTVLLHAHNGGWHILTGYFPGLPNER